MARSTSPDFTTNCLLTTLSETLLVDTDLLAPGAIHYYLNRPLLPSAGSWGERSGAVPRIVCGTCQPPLRLRGPTLALARRTSGP